MRDLHLALVGLDAHRGVRGSAIARFDGVLEPLEARRSELGEERLERFQALGSHDVGAALTLGSDGDEPGITEHYDAGS